MLERCKKDLSLSVEARKVPVVPRALEPGEEVSGKRKRDGTEPKPDLPKPYPLFAYCVKSPGNPVVRTSACCQCPGNCRTNPECACRKRYPGDIPLQAGTERLTDGQLGYKVSRSTSAMAHAYGLFTPDTMAG